MTARVLIVEDDPQMGSMLVLGLQSRGYLPALCKAAHDALALLAVEDFDVVLTDLNMPGMTGIALCERIVGNRPDVPVVVLTAFGSLETAVAAIRAGAYDFVTKPLEIDALKIVLDRTVAHRTLDQEVRRLRQVVAGLSPHDEVVGSSAAITKVYALIDRVADSESSVLITGESGTGKEVAARALHRRSRRRDGPFVAINCAAVPEALLESELFGHVKGAFTDAKSARVGLFVQASGGTLLLDEIGELPLGLQPKLLRALQERKVRPVGASDEVAFDARVISATNRDLEVAVERRAFREDLLYRINVIGLALPPLRERSADILMLAQRFLGQLAARAGKKITGFTTEAASMLVSCAWPGNVRELQNCIERAVALSAFDQILPDDLPDKVRLYRPQPEAPAEPGVELLTLEEVERRHILRVLEAVGGSRILAARALKVDRKTLYRKLERWAMADEPEPP